MKLKTIGRKKFRVGNKVKKSIFSRQTKIEYF